MHRGPVAELSSEVVPPAEDLACEGERPQHTHVTCAGLNGAGPRTVDLRWLERRGRSHHHRRRIPTPTPELIRRRDGTGRRGAGDSDTPRRREPVDPNGRGALHQLPPASDGAIRMTS